ncbi:small membrane protein YmiC [Enterobacter sp. R1(2018)]|nr:small membrane protein YmiC [Enterobacter sp. R1(2018)]
MINHCSIKYWSWLGAFTVSVVFWAQLIATLVN